MPKGIVNLRLAAQKSLLQVGGRGITYKEFLRPEWDARPHASLESDVQWECLERRSFKLTMPLITVVPGFLDQSEGA
jgi:hypothetical protein